MDFTIRHIGLYRRAEKNAYASIYHTIGLNITGLERFEQQHVSVAVPGAGFFFTPANTPLSFIYSAKRENFALLLQSNDIRANERGAPMIRYDKDWIQLPIFTPVPIERISGWRSEVERMRQAFCSPTSRNRWRAELGVLNIFRHLADMHADELAETPASQLKILLDNDKSYAQSLEELSAQCGYSCDHLRVLFAREFGLSPKQYRDRRRMIAAMELVSNSALSIKEIAGKLGFSQASHLTAMFKTVHGLSPREAIRRLRHNVSDVSAEPSGFPQMNYLDVDSYCPDSCG